MDANLTVVGFGRTAEVNGELPDVLNGATLGYVDPEACEQAYAVVYPSYLLDEDTMLCAAAEGKDRYVLYLLHTYIHTYNWWKRI